MITNIIQGVKMSFFDKIDIKQILLHDCQCYQRDP